MSEVLAILERGAPYIEKDAPTDTTLDRYVERAVRWSLLAHRALHEAFRAGDPRIVVFDDPDEGEKGKAKFFSFGDKSGKESYDNLEEGRTDTDGGARSLNPDYPLPASTVTIIHANKQAEAFFEERGAVDEIMEAVTAVADLDNYVVETIAKDALAKLAEDCKMSPEEYVRIFYPGEGKFQRTITRVIMYHRDIRPSQRPTGSDGKVLGGKEHFDRSAWTFKLRESAPGFEWLDKTQSPPLWVPVEQSAAAFFRSAADAYLPASVEVPPCGHRATYDKVIDAQLPPEMSEAGISRWAAVTFAIASLRDTVAVRPSSDETHRVGS